MTTRARNSQLRSCFFLLAIAAAGVFAGCASGDKTLDAVDANAVSLNPTFDQVNAIIHNKCVMCHDSNGGEGGESGSDFRFVLEGSGSDTPLTSCTDIVALRGDYLEPRAGQHHAARRHATPQQRREADYPALGGKRSAGAVQPAVKRLPVFLALGLTAMSATVATLVLTRAALAVPRYSAQAGRACDTCHILPGEWETPKLAHQKRNMSCGTCHVDPAGGGNAHHDRSLLCTRHTSHDCHQSAPSRRLGPQRSRVWPSRQGDPV
jgi:hypothetical protein